MLRSMKEESPLKKDDPSLFTFKSFPSENKGPGYIYMVMQRKRVCKSNAQWHEATT